MNPVRRQPLIPRYKLYVGRYACSPTLCVTCKLAGEV